MPAILPRINQWDPIEMLCCSRKVTLLALFLKIILFIKKEILGSNGQLPGMPFPRIHAGSENVSGEPIVPNVDLGQDSICHQTILSFGSDRKKKKKHNDFLL